MINARPYKYAAASHHATDAPRHEEWLLDEAIRGSFPASDPASSSQPGSIAYARYARSEGSDGKPGAFAE